MLDVWLSVGGWPVAGWRLDGGCLSIDGWLLVVGGGRLLVGWWLVGGRLVIGRWLVVGG